MRLQRGQRSHTISNLVQQHIKVIGGIRGPYNNLLPPRITFRNGVSCHYGAGRQDMLGNGKSSHGYTVQ